MAAPTIRPTGRERTFGQDEIIVTKTDLKGRVTYANEVFLRVAGFDEDEALGEAHNLIRHPEMPACVFQLLWDTISAGREMFGYVLNLAKNGDHYWVYAHITPTFDENGNIIGYHSNRRWPEPSALEKIKPLYAALLAEERRHANKKDGIAASRQLFAAFLGEQGMPYEELVWSL